MKSLQLEVEFLSVVQQESEELLESIMASLAKKELERLKNISHAALRRYVHLVVWQEELSGKRTEIL